MRSKLFVPGSRPELFAKALAGDADALSFDLEDAVVEDRKAEARQAVGQWLASDAARSTHKVLIVRVNAIDSPHFQADIQAVTQAATHYINLPKAESPEDVRRAATAIEQAQAAHGGDARRQVRLLLNIETALALHRATELATAHPLVAGLQLGLGDLFEPLGIDRYEPLAVQQVMLQLRLAAAAAGVFAYDSAYANFGDAAGYATEAALACRLGFLGKSCIHPSQVALANAAFRPSDDQVAHALRVLAAADAAQASGTGAFVVDGRMVDRPFIERARATVAQARRSGQIAP